MKKAFIILASLMVCIVLLFGCTAAPETTTTTQTTTTTTNPPTSTTTTTPAVTRSILQCPQPDPDLKLTPQYGGILKILYWPTPTNLGAPWIPGSPFDAQCNRFAIEGLVGLDANAIPVPQLAEKWENDTAKKTLTFTLRQGVKFHDGTPFNAEAVKWNLNMEIAQKNPGMKDVTSIDVIDDSHLRINYSAWNALFIQQFCASNIGDMVSPTAAQKLIDAGKKDDITRNPVGTGPFKLVSFTPNVSIKYERFNDYWQKGLPYLDGVEISFVSDAVVKLTSFTKGEAHVNRGITTKDAKSLKTQGYTIDSYIATIMSIAFDSNNPSSPFAQQIVREAIAYAIDRNTIINSVFDNMYLPTNQLAAQGCQAYNSSIQDYPYNVDKAKELLGLAGYSTANPLKTKIVYVTDPQRTDCFTAVQAALAKVGIELTLEGIDQGAYNTLQKSGWHNHLLEYRFSYNGFEMQYSTTLGQNLAEGRQNYMSLYSPPVLNALYNTMLAENDLAKREELYKQINKMAIDDYCIVVPLMIQLTLTAKSPKLHDLGMSQGTSGEFLPERAWLEK